MIFDPVSMALGITGQDYGMNLFIHNQMYQGTVPNARTVHDPLKYMLREANYFAQFYKSHIQEPMFNAREHAKDIIIDVKNLLKGAAPMQPAYSYSHVFDAYLRR
jgi:hypothetical protein